MSTVNKYVTQALRIIMGASCGILFTVTFLQVVFRFVLSWPLPWAQDIIRLCFTYLIYCGAAYCVKEHAHLNIDMLQSALRPKQRTMLELAINVVLLAFFVFIFVFGLKFASSGATQVSPYLQWPMRYYYYSIPLCGLLMFYFLIQQMADQVKLILHLRRHPEENIRPEAQAALEGGKA